MNRTICFFYEGQEFKPEIDAYLSYFRSKGWNAHHFTSLQSLIPDDIDVAWHFCGLQIDKSIKAKLKIHEYTTASNPPLAKLKNFGKGMLNSTPDLRIFGNHFVRTQFQFLSSTPEFFRDAGVDSSFFVPSLPKKNIEFDFVYHGTLHKIRRIPKLLMTLAEQCPEKKVLILGKVEALLKHHLAKYPNLIFHGPVPYHEVPHWLQKARYGLAYIPDVYPLNRQTPLKFLEYAAAGLGIIATDTPWMRAFEQKHQCTLFKLKPDLSNLTASAIHAFPHPRVDVSEYEWSRVIERSGIPAFLLERLSR